ncbi:unnamed protein product [Urochloa humidicola]
MVYRANRGGGRRDGFGAGRQGRGGGRTGGRNTWFRSDTGGYRPDFREIGEGSHGYEGRGNLGSDTHLRRAEDFNPNRDRVPVANEGKAGDKGKKADDEENKDRADPTGPESEAEPRLNFEQSDRGGDRSRWAHREEMRETRFGPESSRQATEHAAQATGIFGETGRFPNPNNTQVPQNQRPNGCATCGLRNHTSEECLRRMICENCGLNNHSTYDCKREPPWNYGPELCATQVEDQSFFFIEERIDPRASRDKSSTVIITVTEGEASARDIEAEFRNTVDSSVWRWAARKIAANKFTMRFPDMKMVQVYSSFKSLGMKTTNAQIVVEPWNSAIGAKGELQLAWFRVKGIPIDQRSIKTVAKVGGLVGKTMAIDEKTRLRSEYVRMRIACRDARKVPASVEGTLGLKLYDFFFERGVMEEAKEEGNKIGVQNDEPSGQPNPKRVRTSSEKENPGTPETDPNGPKDGTPVTHTKQVGNKYAAGSTPGKMEGNTSNVQGRGAEKPSQADDPVVGSSGDSEETDYSEDFSEKLARVNAQYQEGGSSQTDQLWLMQCSDSNIYTIKDEQIENNCYPTKKVLLQLLFLHWTVLLLRLHCSKSWRNKSTRCGHSSVAGRWRSIASPLVPKMQGPTPTHIAEVSIKAKENMSADGVVLPMVAGAVGLQHMQVYLLWCCRGKQGL